MNNPYRAHPTRSRVDHASVSNYGALNQNAWGPTPSRVQARVPPSNSFQQQSRTTVQQQQSDDSWNWGTENANNGNDSWNWSVDQQPEAQQRQQQQQQQQFVPGYASSGQTVPNSIQENYYQNLNGNNRSNLLNQHSISGRTTPRISTSRESTPNLSDPYTHYTNYSHNQQYPAPSGLNMKSNPVLATVDHSQWPKDQQPQSMHYTQQKPSVQNQQNQAPPPPQVNSYNWNNVDQQNVSQQHSWQSHSEGPASGYWHNSNLKKEQQHIENVGNQWQSQEVYHPQIPQTFAPTQNVTINEHSVNSINQQQDYNASNSWTNQSTAASNQWLDRNSESAMPTRWQQPVQNFQSSSTAKPSDKAESIASPHQWQQITVHHDAPLNERMQETTETSGFSITEKSSVQENNLNKISMNDGQQILPPPSHFTSPSESTTSDSILNISSSVERQEEGKGSVVPPITNSSSLNDFLIPPNVITKSATVGDRQNWAASSEINVPFNNSEPILVQDNTKADWNLGKHVPTCELSSGFGQLSLGSKSDNSMENQISQHDVRSSIQPTDDWSSKSISGSLPVDNNTSENVSILPPKHVDSVETAHSIGGQSNVAQEQSLPPTYQLGHVNVAENVSQTGYDQWYNRSTVAEQSENEWYSKDQARPPKQWSSEQNVENYENIQQPSEFVNLEVVAPVLQERDIYGSRDSINKETLDNDPKLVTNSPKEAVSSRDFRQAVNNVEVPTIQQPRQPLQVEQTPDNYEFASNDRNTFLETGELTDSHQEHEPTPPSQDDENDEVPNDIPFLREVPGQSSSADPRRNDPTGQEQYVQAGPRVSDPRRNDPSGQEQNLPTRIIPDRTERRDVPPGQERTVPLLIRADTDTLERRNDPSGRERSLPPQQSRNDPSGEERIQSQQQVIPQPSETREVPGRGNETEESIPQTDSELRQIPGGVSPNEAVQKPDDRNDTRVVTGSQEVATLAPLAMMQDQSSETRNKREEAVGASKGENQGVSGISNRRDSYEDGDDEGSGNSRDESRERRRDGNSDQRRYDYDRKGRFYDRDRDYDEDYYYDRRRGGDYDRAYNSRDDLDHREAPYREDDRRHQSRDDLERRGREDVDRRGRTKDDLDDRDGRRRVDDRRRDKGDDPRRRDRDRERDFESRFSRDREYSDRDKRREDRRGRRYDDYDPRDSLRREYYDDPYGRNSRPSSRSSYNDRDRDYYLRARDPYYGYNSYGGYDYGANYNNNYYAYLENLRRTNPAAYAEWYHKYYASQHQQQEASRGVASYQEDRASVHSGRSSCNDRTTTDKQTLGDMSVIEDSAIASARLTPIKFSTAHVYGSFALGSFLHVHPSYPADGERAKVDILQVDSLLQHDSVARELRTYPGPLIKQVGVTHKKTIIEYCDSKIKKAATNEEMEDRASYILLYELMIMLIQQNGNVVGVDIATLLLTNKDAYPYEANKQQISKRRESIISQRSAGKSVDGNVCDTATPHEIDESIKPQKLLSIEQITNEFRNTLLYGLVQEALEYAMVEGLWGHALFLASKLDKRTHASVMTRFANSLPASDPLQTLYQLHSGRVPASVTCVADPKWDDWRPHLAMIISNTSANPEINRKSVTTLGDTLAARGNIHAAHFCYILAQIEFGSYYDSSSKLVLIGSNHHQSYSEFASTEAIMLTEIYEYARNLSEPGFALVDLQTFKFELAMMMVDYGLMEKALLYIEQIAVNIVSEPAKYKKSFIKEVYTLGDRIKYHDPICKDSVEDAANLVWLNNLAEIVGKCQSGEIIQDDVYDSHATTDLRNVAQNQEHHDIQQQQQNWVSAQPEYSEGQTSLMEGPSMEVQTEWQPLSLPNNLQDPYNMTSQNAKYMENCVDSNQSQQQQGYWGQQSYSQQDYKSQDYVQTEWQQHSNQSQYPSTPMESEVTDQTQQHNKWSYESEREDTSATPEPQPKISMTPSSTKQYDPLEELDALDMPNQALKTNAEGKKAAEKSSDKKNSAGGGSWFGGLFSKLAPKPKNQMILPDDNNPTIIWDPVAKKWMNKDEGTEISSGQLAPPPKVSAMEFKLPSIEPTANSISAMQPAVQSEESVASANSSNLLTGSNIYKLPKGRSMRANYIDVMNPSGTKNSGTTTLTTPVASPLAPVAASSPQLFVPAAVNDPAAPVNFLTPVQTVPVSENVPQGLSRWSSTSSLSREVQSYTMRDPRLLLRDKGPMMFNPADVKDRSAKNAPRSRYPPQ